jgi:hypothetical protein
MLTCPIFRSILSCVSADAQSSCCTALIKPWISFGKQPAAPQGRAWQDVLDRFEAIQDDWSAIEAVVHLELLLEAEGRLIEEKRRESVRSVLISYTASVQLYSSECEVGSRAAGVSRR